MIGVDWGINFAIILAKAMDSYAKTKNKYCVKNVRILRCFSPPFPTFGLNTEIYSYGPEKLRIRTLFRQ